MKIARIFDQDPDAFGLEYDNAIGKKHTMRLDALTYENAIREAKRYLGIDDNNHDAEGSLWQVE